MRRGYRLFVLAAFGWLILANAPHPQRSADKQSDQGKSTQPLAPRPQPDPQGPQHREEECKGTTRPDLSCNAISAQAALDQARDADRQVSLAAWQTAVGALTLLAAIGAAIFAERAAHHTKRSADIAEKTASDTVEALAIAGRNADATIEAVAETRRANEIIEANHRESLRPYVVVSHGKFEIDDSIQPIAIIELKNFGQSPAIDVETWFHIWVECFPLHDPLPRAPADLPKGKRVIGPGATSDIYHPRGGPLSALEQREIIAGRAAIYVFGETTYSDIWGDRFCSEFILFASGEEQVRQRRLAAYVNGNAIRRMDS